MNQTYKSIRGRTTETSPPIDFRNIYPDTPVNSSKTREPPPAFLIRHPVGTPVEKLSPNARKSHVSWQPFFEAGNEPVNREDTLPPGQTFIANRKKANNKTVNDKGGFNNFVQQWCHEDVKLSMTKTSITGLILGLMFLGILFFVVGFLSAIATLGRSETQPLPSAWQSSNSTSTNTKSQEAKKLDSLFDRTIGAKIRHELAPFTQVPKIPHVSVPPSLQPFARYGTSQARTQASRTMNSARNGYSHSAQPHPSYSNTPLPYDRAPSFSPPASPPASPPGTAEGYPAYNRPYGYDQPGLPSGSMPDSTSGWASLPLQPQQPQQPQQQMGFASQPPVPGANAPMPYNPAYGSAQQPSYIQQPPPLAQQPYYQQGQPNRQMMPPQPLYAPPPSGQYPAYSPSPSSGVMGYR